MIHPPSLKTTGKPREECEKEEDSGTYSVCPKSGKEKEAIIQESMMTVKLSSCGNPDLQQNPNDSLSPKVIFQIATLKGASLICMKYIASWNLGGGNWSGGQIYKGKKQIASVSYNGRIWDLKDKEIFVQ